MATKIFLRDVASELTVGSATNKLASIVQGSAVVSSDATATVTGATSGVQVKKSSVVLTWFSNPFRAITISGTITFNLWGLESATQANTGFDVLVERCDQNGNVLSTIVRSERGTELGTSSAVNNWTAAPTSTNLNEGDRIKITVFGNDAGGTMASGRTFTLNYDAGTGVSGDSYVQVNENLLLGSVGNDIGAGTDATSVSATVLSASQTGAGTDAASAQIIVPNTLDTFTGADTTLLQNHTADTGAIWAHPSYAAAADAIINGNKLTKDSQSFAATYYEDTVRDADCWNRQVVTILSINSSQRVRLLLRLNTASENYYLFQYSFATNLWGIFADINGVIGSALGTTYSEVLSVSDVRTMEFRIVGSTLQGWVDGVIRCTATDSSLSAAGKCGLTISGSGSSTTNVSVDNYESGSTAGNPRIADSGTGTDSASIAGNISASEIGAGADVVSTTTSLAISEIGVGTESASVISNSSASEIGAGSESSTLVVTVNAPETFPGSDSVNINSGTNVNAADTGAGTDSSTVSSNISVSETTPGTDSKGVSSFLSVSETGTGAESSTIVVTVTSSETSPGSDSVVINSGSSINVSETGAGTGSISIISSIPVSESGAGVDSRGTSVSFSISETGAGFDSADVTVLPTSISADESGAGIDSVSVSYSVSASESSPGTSTVALDKFFFSNEDSPGHDSAGVFVSVTTHEDAPGSDSIGIQIPQKIVASQSGAGIDSIAINQTDPTRTGKWLVL